ncbi:MAG TPA: PEGA domain-containing protein [Patescibacteria group bacterium]|nr:PEGA domain-containing protein [Patescibacteria group bacterium]
MTKLRVIILFTTFLVVGIIGYFVALIARGYRFDIDKFKFLPNGILVTKSDPDGASIYINGDLKGATNTNIKLSPNSYDVEIKKEGYITWSKRLTVKKEEVTQITAQLFKTAPSLSPITFNGAENPVVSDDFGKIAYTNNEELWIMSVSTLPIGFPNSPKKIADGIIDSSTYLFSPNGQELLLETNIGAYLLNTNEFTSQAQRVNISNKKVETLKTWGLEKQKMEDVELKNLPLEIIDLLKRQTKVFTFSPDETMIMYQALEDTKIKSDLIPRLPGSSTQKEERDIKLGKKYIYDIKEDKNYYVGEENSNLYWLPTSRHLIESLDGKIVIMDYDGTNRQTVFSGNYIAPHAYPYVNASKLLILTNLGSDSSTPNLYSLSIK